MEDLLESIDAMILRVLFNFNFRSLAVKSKRTIEQFSFVVGRKFSRKNFSLKVSSQ